MKIVISLGFLVFVNSTGSMLLAISMREECNMLVLKILGFLFLVPGVLMVFMAKQLVEKFKLGERTKIDFEHEMNEEELEQFKEGKATVNMKMLGMLVALPGFILILIAFK